MLNESFRFGDWQVSPTANSLKKGDICHQIEPRLMEVLLVLCQRANDVVSSEELLILCWGNTIYGDNPVHKTIAQLRRVLGDSVADARYIETIRKRGYRTIADVSLPNGPTSSQVVGTWQAGSPFCGLSAFHESHTAVFFGRAAVINQFKDSLQRQVNRGCAFMLLLGPSGSGKSSLMRAGVLPSLMRDEGDWRLESSCVFDPVNASDAVLFRSLADSLLTWQIDGRAIFGEESAESLGRRLIESPNTILADVRWSLARGQLPSSKPRKLALFVDRLEVLFNFPGPACDLQASFIALLERMACSGEIVVLAACRNDFYPRLTTHPFLMAGKAHGSHFDLLPPTMAEMAQIIRMPALAANLSFGIDPVSKARLDDQLCADAARSADALPLLQYALQTLYERRTSSGELSFSAFDTMGGLEGAIGQRAEAVLTSLDEAQQAALPHILSLLIVLSLDDEAVSSQRASWSAISGDAGKKLVMALVESRLFVSELVLGQPGFGIAHEALLRHWPRISEWIEQHRHSLRVRARMAHQAARWLREGKRHDLLLPTGRQLEEAKELLAAGTVTLTGDEASFLAASQQRATQRYRVRLLALSTVVALALLVGGLGAVALRASHVAQLRRAEAEGLMGYMLGDFADKVRPLGRLDLLDDISNRSLLYLGKSAAEDESPASLTQRAQALAVIAEVRIARADPAGAISALNSGRSILLKQLAAGPGNVAVLKQLGSNAFWLGKLFMDKGDWAQTNNYFRYYLDYSERRSALEPDDVDGWIEQSYAHNNLGTLALTIGSVADAAQEFRTSIALKQRAQARRPDDRSLAAELADSFSWEGLAEEKSGRLEQAAGYYAQEDAVTRTLHTVAPNDALWTYRLALALQHGARLDIARGDIAAARSALSEGKGLLDEIVHLHPDNRTWQKDRIALLLDAAAASDAGSTGWLPSLREASGTLRELIARYPKNTNWVRLQGICYTRLAAAYANSDKVEARRLSELGVTQLRQLNALDRTEPKTRQALANALLLSAQLSDPIAANADCREAQGLLADQAATSMDYQLLAPWVRAQACLGTIGKAGAAIGKLSAMAYRDPEYLRTVDPLKREETP